MFDAGRRGRDVHPLRCPVTGQRPRQAIVDHRHDEPVDSTAAAAAPDAGTDSAVLPAGNDPGAADRWAPSPVDDDHRRCSRGPARRRRRPGPRRGAVTDHTMASRTRPRRRPWRRPRRPPLWYAIPSKRRRQPRRPVRRFPPTRRWHRPRRRRPISGRPPPPPLRRRRRPNRRPLPHRALPRPSPSPRPYG